MEELLEAFIRGTAELPAGAACVARRDHDWISTAVVVTDAPDYHVWTCWTDGPRAGAEEEPGLSEAMWVFIHDVILEGADSYFGPGRENGWAALNRAVEVRD